MTVAEARRELTGAVAASVVAGALALVAAGETWAQVALDRPAPLPPVDDALSGTDAAPLVPAAGLVLLAAAVALSAVRGGARVAVGLLAAVAGGALAWSGVHALAGGLQDRSVDVLGLGQGRGAEIEVAAAWPTLAVVAGILAMAVGAFVVVRGRGWPAMGRRYERPVGATEAAARPAPARTDEDRAQDAWKALDRGEDPTA